MKTITVFGVRCAAMFVVMTMVMTTGSMIMMMPTVNADVPKGPAAVNLGTAGDFAILTKTGISTTGTTLITGNIGVSPIDQTGQTGFSETMDSTNQFSTSAYVVGKLYAADYTDPTPAKLTSAVRDMETAYTDAAGRTLPDATELGAGDISSMTLAPGLYKWGTGVNIDNRGVTLSGGASDVWIFQISQDLTVADAAIVTLSGGALASNVFWQVGGGTGATLGTTSVFKGNILAVKSIVLNTGATLNGRALAQTAVTLDANSVTSPPVQVTTGPTLTIPGLADNSEVKASKLTITGTATDNVPITRVEVRVNGGNWEPATGTTKWSYAAALNEGKNTIEFRVTDASGNTASQTRTVKYVKETSTPGFEIALFAGAAFVAFVVAAGSRRKRGPSSSII
jgi:hypothetical protein